MNKKLLLIPALTIAVTGISFASSHYTTQTEKLGYSIGYDMGSAFKKQDTNVDFSSFQAGYKDAQSGTTAALTAKQRAEVMDTYRTSLIKKMQAKEKAAGATNLQKSNAYISKISKEAGVKKIATGIYYKVLKKGDGATPTKSDVVKVNYEGTLINGKIFDSSYKRHQPAKFPVGAVIPGWTKALMHMPVGSTWVLYLAPSQAYGQNGPPQIGPNQALTFKIDLLDIEKK